MKRAIYLIPLLILSFILMSGTIDLNELFNYGNQNIPPYIQKDNTPLDNAITDDGATLGRVLFYDKNLSANNTIACASCHKQELGFGDDAIASVGLNGELTGRHSMRIVNSRFSNEEKFFWDERAISLEDQTTKPIQDHVEMGFSGTDGDPDFDDLITKLEAVDYYEDLFTAAFGDTQITEDRISKALAQFVRSIQSYDSKYDAGIAMTNNPGVPFPNFTQSENNGKALFMGPGASCNVCHAAPEFDIDPNTQNNGVIGVFGNPGLVDLTNTRAPSLRDVANANGVENGPFMHDGSLATLLDVVNHYNQVPFFPNVNPDLDPRLRGGPPEPGTPPDGIGQELELTEQEKADLVAFMKTLGGTAVYTDERWSDPFSPNGELALENGTYDIFVDESATGTNDGKSWTNAYTDLQDALALGENFNIHIAEGTYKPTSTTSRSIFFNIPSGTSILGGYPAGGGDRDFENYTTILSGDVDGIEGYEGNSYHVVRLANVGNVSIDGIQISEGGANNSNSFGRARGGGIYSTGSNFMISNSTISNNEAIYGGGMFATLSPEVNIVDCLIEGNEAGNGSALYHSNETNMYINRTRIIDNNSLIRCAIEINNSLYTKIENSVIANNDSSNANALGFIATNRDQSCDIDNTTILGEIANKQLITFQIGFNDVLTVNINNSIIAHQNISHSNNVKAFNNGVLNFTHNNCYFQGDAVIGTGTGTLFSAIDGSLLLNPDYSVEDCSPVVNAGESALAVGDTDIDGNERVFDVVDMGAYEAQSSCLMMRESSAENTFEEEVVVEVFPNPTSGMIRIESNSDHMIFTIYDIFGKQLLRTQTRDLDISNYPTGMYIIKAEKDGKFISSTKLLKQ